MWTILRASLEPQSKRQHQHRKTCLFVRTFHTRTLREKAPKKSASKNKMSGTRVANVLSERCSRCTAYWCGAWDNPKPSPVKLKASLLSWGYACSLWASTNQPKKSSGNSSKALHKTTLRRNRTTQETKARDPRNRIWYFSELSQRVAWTVGCNVSRFLKNMRAWNIEKNI